MSTTTKTSTGLIRFAKMAAVASVLAATTACTAVQDLIISDKLDGTSWRVVSIDDFAIPQGVDVTMAFGADESVSGIAGCNSYMVRNIRTEGGVAFTQIATTRMFCPDPKMMTETLFVDALSRVNNFRRNAEGQLVIFGPDVVIMLDPAS